MATFRVRQRVRVVGLVFDAMDNDRAAPAVGMTGAVLHVGSGPMPYLVSIDGGPLNAGGKPEWRFADYELAPITDPLAERFVESLKRLAREPMPQKETA